MRRKKDKKKKEFLGYCGYLKGRKEKVAWEVKERVSGCGGEN